MNMKMTEELKFANLIYSGLYFFYKFYIQINFKVLIIFIKDYCQQNSGPRNYFLTADGKIPQFFPYLIIFCLKSLILKNLKTNRDRVQIFSDDNRVKLKKIQNSKWRFQYHNSKCRTEKSESYLIVLKTRSREFFRLLIRKL